MIRHLFGVGHIVMGGVGFCLTWVERLRLMFWNALMMNIQHELNF